MHTQKSSPGLVPGGMSSSSSPGRMPSKKTGAKAGGNHRQGDNGCWHKGSTGSGKKGNP